MRMPLRLGPWIQATGAVALLLMLTSMGLALESSYKPDVRCPQGPTASKTQSKLWFNDGSWWGILFDGSSEEYRIHRYNAAGGSWSNTGTTVDKRNASRADVLWEEDRLYVVSAGTETDLADHDARFSRYSYDPSTESYSLDEGFPVKVAEGGTEAVTIARDTTGGLWASYMQDVGDDLRRVYVTHTQDGDDARWTEPFTPPLEGTTGNSDDVSGIVAFGSQVGLAWSNQNDESGKAGYYFATHDDGEPEDSWRPDNPVMGPEWANDHLNLKTDSEGRVYMTLKTRRDRIDRELGAPYNMLWVRDREGEWTDHVFGTVGDSHTRAQLLIDEEERLLYMLASSPTCSGGKVYYKRAPLDDISFEEGKGDLFMRSSDGTPIGDATSTKQPIDSRTGGMVVASNEVRDYYYNLIDPRDQQKLFPNGSPIDADRSGG